MLWISEMFASMEKDLAESAKRSAHMPKVELAKHLTKKIPDTQAVWNALISSITNDVNEFNNHKERAGQTAVCVSSKHFRCEVYLPGLQSKRMVLTLDNNDLQVSVHPEFPKQQLAITIELDQDGQHGFWVLGGTTKEKESAKLSVQQLSEYLLKPILSSAAINREL